MKPVNFTRVSKEEFEAIPDYPAGYIRDHDAMSRTIHRGNTLVRDDLNRVFNCHPLTDAYKEHTNGLAFPIRWQVTSEHDQSIDGMALEYLDLFVPQSWDDVYDAYDGDY